MMEKKRREMLDFRFDCGDDAGGFTNVTLPSWNPRSLAAMAGIWRLNRFIEGQKGMEK